MVTPMGRVYGSTRSAVSNAIHQSLRPSIYPSAQHNEYDEYNGGGDGPTVFRAGRKDMCGRAGLQGQSE